MERQDEEKEEEEEVFYTNVLRYLCTGFHEIWNKLRGKLRILACLDSDSFLSISFGAVQRYRQRERGEGGGECNEKRVESLYAWTKIRYGKLILVLSRKTLAPLNECNDSFKISHWINKLLGKESFRKNAISLDDKRPKLLKAGG